MLAALEEVIAAFPVYRTYVSRDAAPARTTFATSNGRSRRQRSDGVSGDTSIFDFLQRVLTGRLARPQLDRRRGAAGGDAFPAGDRPGHGQGLRGYRVLPLFPAAGAQRGRRRSAALWHVGRCLSSPDAGSRPRLAARHGDDGDARHQARRGCPRAAGAAVRDAARVGPARSPMAASQPVAPSRDRRRDSCPIATSSTCFIRPCVGAWPPGLDPGDADADAGLSPNASRPT